MSIGGSGRVPSETYVTGCRRCRGTGQGGASVCPDCEGSGFERRRRRNDAMGSEHLEPATREEYDAKWQPSQ